MTTEEIFYHNKNFFTLTLLGYLEILKQKLESGEKGEFNIAGIKVTIEDEIFTMERKGITTRIKKSIENYPTIYQRFYALYADGGKLAEMGIWSR